MQLLVGTEEKFWYKYEGLGYFDRIKESIGKKKFLDIFEKLDVLPHFVILSYIILDLTRDMPKKKRLVLINKLSDAIRNACTRRNKKKEITNLSKDRLMKVVKEYEEYEYFSFSYKKLLNYALKIIKYKEPYGRCDECKRITPFRIKSDVYLCPKCARKRFGEEPVHLILKKCRKCGYAKWIPMDDIKVLEFCEKDGMLMYNIPGKFHIPHYL